MSFNSNLFYSNFLATHEQHGATSLGNGHTTLNSTSSRLITEVKQCWARLVLGWVTAWEPRVLLPNFLFFRPGTFFFTRTLISV